MVQHQDDRPNWAVAKSTMLYLPLPHSAGLLLVSPMPHQSFPCRHLLWLSLQPTTVVGCRDKTGIAWESQEEARTVQPSNNHV